MHKYLPTSSTLIPHSNSRFHVPPFSPISLFICLMLVYLEFGHSHFTHLVSRCPQSLYCILQPNLVLICTPSPCLAKLGPIQSSNPV